MTSFHTSLAFKAAFVLCCSTVACSGDDSDDSDSECTSLRATGAPIDASVDYGGTPLPVAGGAIQDGTYRLTAKISYVPSDSVILLNCEGATGVLRLGGGGFEMAVGCYFFADDPESLVGEGVFSGRYAASGTDFSFEYSCPEELVEAYTYSAEPPNLRMLIPDPDDPVTTELVWTLE